MGAVQRCQWHLVVTTVIFGIITNTAAQVESETMFSAFEGIRVEEFDSLTTVAEVEQFLDRIRRATKVEMAKNFAKKTRLFKRDLDIHGVNITGVNKMEYNFSVDEHLITAKFTAVKYFSHKGRHFMFCAQNSKHHQFLIELMPPGYLGSTSMKLKIRAKFLIESIFTRDITIIAAHVFNGEIWIALANGDEDLINTLSITLQDFAFEDKLWMFTIPQVCYALGAPGDLSFFDTKEELFLVVGNQYFISKENRKITSWLFCLRSGFFDILEDMGMKTQGVTSLTTFHDHGHVIIVFGCQSTLGSVVYIFNPLLKILKPMNWYLPNYNVSNVQHYTDTQEGREMIIFTNKDKKPEIYWWTGDQMEMWQTVDYHHHSTFGSMVSTFKVDAFEDIIAFTDGSFIDFYVDDSSAYFVEKFSYPTTCTISISFIQLFHDMDTDNDYIICGCDQTFYLFQLIHHEIQIVPEPKLDELISCVAELETQLEDRKDDIAYLERVMEEDLIMSTDHDQIWNGPITFTDTVKVEESTVFASQVTVGRTVGPQMVKGILPDLASNLENLRNHSSEMYFAMENVLTISGEQTITSADLTNSLVADDAIFNKLNLEIINNVPLSNLSNYFLMHETDQTINTPFNFTTLKVDTFSTRGLVDGTINNIKTSDLMRKSVSDQIVTGHHVYTNIHMNGNVFHPDGPDVAITVNTVSSDSWVMEGSDVTFTEPCTFSNLSVSKALHTDSVNGVSVKDLHARAIFTDAANKEIKGNITIRGDLTVEGNIDVPSVNGIDIVDLDRNTVKNNGNFTILGPVEYKKNLFIDQDLLVVKVNDIFFDDIIDLNSDTLITSVFTFGNITVTGDVNCDDINGMDISEEAVLLHGDQVIQGRIRFENSVSVEDQVFMEEFAEVNGVDPSDLKNSMDGSGIVFIDKDIIINGKLEVVGNVSARVINNITFSGFEDNYWRKTKNQNIPFNTQIQKAIFNAALTVGTLNNVRTKDYLLINGDQIITGQYIFDDHVTIKGNLEMEEYKTIDGVDLSELKKDLVTLDGDQQIIGSAVFEGHTDVMKNLDVTGKINGLSIPEDIMQMDVINNHTGSVTFTGNISVPEVEVDHDITVDTINGYDLNEIVDNTVYKNEDVTIYGPGITFLNEIAVTGNLEVVGLIDGVNFRDFVTRALKKNSDVTQHVTGHFKVEGDAYFGGILNLKTVNDLDWRRHLENVVDVNYTGYITGNKSFTKLVNVKEDLICDDINQIDISVLQTKILSKSKDQTITGNYNFTNNLRIGHLQSKWIDGVDTNNLAHLDQNTAFEGVVTFLDDIILEDGLYAPHNNIDGCNIDSLDRSRIWTVNDGVLKMPSDIIIGDLTVHGNVYTRGEGKVLLGSEEVDLDYFLTNLVTVNGEHTITGSVTFLGDVEVTNMNATYLGGVLTDKFMKNSVRKSHSQTIHSDLIFENTVNVQRLNVEFDIAKRDADDYMTVNGINLQELNKNLVRTTEETVLLTGNKTFINGLHVEHLDTDFLGDIRVSDLVLLNTDSVLSNISFMAPITVQGNLQVNGLVDGVNLHSLLNKRVTLHSDQEITGNVICTTLSVDGDLDVEYINDVQISDLVLSSDEEVQVITGSKSIKGGITVLGSIQTNSTINDLDIVNLNQTVVRKNQPSVLRQNIVFEKTVAAPNSVISNDNINDWLIEDLPQALLTLNETIANEAVALRQMLPEIDKCNTQNIEYAQGIFEELSYVQRLSFTLLENAKYVHYVDDFIYVTVQADKSCMIYDECFCTRKTYTYKLSLDGVLTIKTSNPNDPDSEPLVIEGSYHPVTHPNKPDVQYSFTTYCLNGVPYTQMRYGDRSSDRIKTEKLNQAVDQVENFIFGGKIYFVMVTPQKDIGDKVVVISYGKRGVSYINQPILTKMRGLKISITEFYNDIYLLISGHLNIHTSYKKFITNSLVYIWNGNLQQFVQAAKVGGSHVTSGSLVTVMDPNPMVFLILSQLKNADTDHFQSNQNFNKPALVFKHTRGSGFYEYEALEEIKGATAHTYFRVDRDLHLCFTVPKDNSMYIYKYVPMEGFVFQQKATLSSPANVVSMEIYENGRNGGRMHGFLAVTSFEGIYIFKMKTKGVNPRNIRDLKKKI